MSLQLQEPLRIFLNGEERRITDFGRMEVFNRNIIHTNSPPNQIKKTHLTSMTHLNRVVLETFEENDWSSDVTVLLKGLRTDQGEEFSLILHSSGSEHCESDVAGFINGFRDFRRSSGFVYTYDFSKIKIDQFIWDSYVKSENLLTRGKRATYFLNNENITFEALDQIDLAKVRAVTFMKPTYAKQQYGEMASNGAVVIQTK